MKVPEVKDRNVLVTGCSSGIGEATAFYLREKGWNVIPTARKSEDMEKLRINGFDPVALDLADPESVASAASETLEYFGGVLGGLVNNAAFAQIGAVEDISRDALRYQFEVNVFGTHDLTNRFIPVLHKQGWGRIVNVSSVYGRISAPIVGSYCASKYAMEALSDAMRIELRGSGVSVSLIEPGSIISELRRTAGRMAEVSIDLQTARFKQKYAEEIIRRKGRKPNRIPHGLPPEAVALKIFHALDSRRPKHRYCITWQAYFVAFVRRFFPVSLLDRILASQSLVDLSI